MAPLSKVIRVFVLLLALSALAFSQREPYVEPVSSVEVFGAPIFRGAASVSARVFAVASTEKAMKIYDASKMTEVIPLPPLTLRAYSLSFSGSGQLLYTGSPNGQITVWNTLAGTVSKTFSPHSAAIIALGAYDENLVFTAGIDNVVKISDATTTKVLGSTSLKEEIGALAIYPGGKNFAIGTASGQVLYYNAAQMSLVKSFPDSKEKIVSLLFTADSKYLVAGGADGNLYVWDFQTQVFKTKVPAHRASVYTLTADPKSRWIVSASADSALKFIDVNTFNVTKTLLEKDGYYTFVSFGSNEQLIAGTSKGMVKTWKVLPVPPDTANPAIVLLNPPDGPTVRAFTKQYDITGVAYDDTEVKEVTVNGMPAILSQPSTSELVKVPAGFKAKKFTTVLKLDSVGMAPFQVKATDKFGHTGLRYSAIQRLSNDQAVEVTNPTLNSETDKVSVSVQFKSWFDVASYSLSVNLIDVTTNQTVIGKSPGDIISDEVPLVVGYNEIQLTVVSRSGESFSKTIGISRKISAAAASVPSQGPAKRGPGSGLQKWAVVVGISEYANAGIPKLNYADKDAEAFANFLRRPEGGSYDSDHLLLLLNKDATLANIREALMVFLQKAIDIDFVMIYFAGHGAPDPTRPQNLFLLTYDSDPNKLATSAFPMWDVQTVMSRVVAAKKSVIFTDACHSGGISVDVATRGLGMAEQNPINQFLTDLSKSRPGSVSFTASAANEVSQELTEFGHGAFTYYLLEGMGGKADYDNDGTITINELMRYVEEQVKRKTQGAQNPTRSQTDYDKDMPISYVKQQ